MMYQTLRVNSRVRVYIPTSDHPAGQWVKATVEAIEQRANGRFYTLRCVNGDVVELHRFALQAAIVGMEVTA